MSLSVILFGCATQRGNTDQYRGPIETLRPGYAVVYHPQLRQGKSIESFQEKISTSFMDLKSLKYNLLKYDIVVEKDLERKSGAPPFEISFADRQIWKFWDLASAETAADALYFLQQEQKKERENQDRQIAAFQPLAALYRELAVKPQMTEDQRKYIVQANALNQLKDYPGAIDLYKKAVKVDPVSYPGAYFNLALLSGQIERYSAAITYMKQYLMLVPGAEDARSAQDKIYEWEMLLNR